MRLLLRFFRYTALLSTLIVAISVVTAHRGAEPVAAISKPFCGDCQGTLSSIPIAPGTVGFVCGMLLLLLAFSGRPRTRR